MATANALNIPAGTEGQVLVSQGPGLPPVYANPNNSSAMVLLATGTGTGADFINFTGIISATYFTYRIMMLNFYHTSGSQISIQCSTDNGATYKATTAFYSSASNSFLFSGVAGTNTSATATSILIAPNSASTFPQQTMSAIIDLINPLAGFMKIPYISQYNDATSGRLFRYGSGIFTDVSAVNAFRVGVVSGASFGTIKVYGSQT